MDLRFGENDIGLRRRGAAVAIDVPHAVQRD